MHKTHRCTSSDEFGRRMGASDEHSFRAINKNWKRVSKKLNKKKERRCEQKTFAFSEPLALYVGQVGVDKMFPDADSSPTIIRLNCLRE